MESLAYQHLAFVYETSKLSESDRKLEQTQDKVLQAENSNETSNISSLPRIQFIKKIVPSFKINFLIRIKAIALALVLILSNSGYASLVRGSWGKEVVTLQNNLKQLGYFPKHLRSTGYFGTVTEASVGKFQNTNGLVVDGKVGVNTAQSLNNALYTSHKNLNKGKVSRTPILKVGSKGEQVVELNNRLFILGYFAIYEENRNIFDAKVEEAVKKFQKDNNLKIDGIVGLKTNEALFEAIWPSSLSGRALFYRGLKQKMFVIALQDYNEAIKRDKNIAEAYYRRGMSYAYASPENSYTDINRDINKASNDFSEAIKINPDYVEAYLERGIIHDEKKEWKSAIDDWTQAILIDPDNIEAYYRRAKAKEHLKNTKDIINDYIKIIEINLKSEQDVDLKKQIEQVITNFYNNQVSPELMLVLSRVVATAGIYSNLDLKNDVSLNTLKEDLEKVIKNFQNKQGQNILSLLDYYKALSQYEQYEYELDNSSPDNLPKDELPLLLQNFHNLEKKYKENTFASIHYYRGLLLKYQGEQDKAKKEFSKAIKRQSNFTKAYYSRGIIRSKQGDEQKAIRDFKKYLQGDPEMEEAKKMRNDRYRYDEFPEDCFNQEMSKEYLETLESSSVPLEASAYLRRGKLRFLLGDNLGAKKDFQEVIKADPNLAADAYYQKGKVAAYEFYLGEQNMEKVQEAKESFDEAIKREPNLSEAYFERGYFKYRISTQNFYKNNNTNRILTQTDLDLIDDSKKDFQQAIKIDKNFAQAYYLIVDAEKFKSTKLTQKTEGDKDYLTDYKLSTTDIKNLTEAIRSDIYFYSDLIGLRSIQIKRSVCVDLGNYKQDNTTKSASIIPFKSKKEESYYTLALGNYRKKEYKQAIENISQAIKVNPDISDFYLIRGAAYYFSKDKKAALKDFKMSVQLEPELTLEKSLIFVNIEEIPDINTSPISHFLIGRIIENQDSQEEYQIAFSYLPQAYWVAFEYHSGGGGSQIQKTASSSSAKVRSKKCQCR